MEKLIADIDALMHFVDLCIADESGNSVLLKTLFDSGTQLSILKEDLISHLDYEVLGEVKLQGFNGNISSAKIILHNAKLAGHNVYVPLRCVGCQNVSHGCLLSLADYRKLLQCEEVRSVGVTPHTSTDSDEDVPISQNSDVSVQQTDDTDGNITNHVNDDFQVSDDSDVLSLGYSLCTTDSVGNKTSELRREQLEDETLTGAFDFAKHNKGGYLIKNGLLFHRAKVFQNTVERLVVPKGRRKFLLELAHENLGCHLTRKKTKERIGLSFIWPTMNKDVIDFCRTCAVCQKRAPITYLDRVPIEGAWSQLSPCLVTSMLMHWGHCSVKMWTIITVLFLDHASRFPHAVTVRNLAAKSCCEAILSFWQFIGFPTKVTTDNATNFTGEQTRELLKRVGCSPIWCTPRHPEANSVQRTIGTIQSMISKVAQQHAKSWHRYIGMMLFAMRESTNETAGLPPYTLVYERLPVGPLSVLKNVWMNEGDIPTPKNKSTVDFLKTCVISYKRRGHTVTLMR